MTRVRLAARPDRRGDAGPATAASAAFEHLAGSLARPGERRQVAPVAGVGDRRGVDLERPMAAIFATSTQSSVWRTRPQPNSTARRASPRSPRHSANEAAAR